MTRHLVGLLGGLAVAASMPPWGFWPLAPLGVILLGLATSDSRRSRAITTLAFGIGWFGPGMVWMWFLTAPGYVLTTLLFAGWHAIAAAVSPRAPAPRAIAHTLIEAARLVAPFGGVPLATIAIGQAGGPLLPLARIGGVLLITWVVFHIGLSIGGRLAAALDRHDDMPSWAGILAGPLVAILLASLAPTGRDIGSAMTIAAVQGGGRQGTSALEVPSRLVTEAHLAATASIPANGRVDVVLWPENTIDVNGVAFVDSAQADAVAMEAARLGVPMLVGVTEDVSTAHDLELAANDGRGFVNAHYVVTGEGAADGAYVKVRRVPYGEYVPLRDLLESLGAPVGQIPRDAVAGAGPAVLDLPDGERLAVAISWEVFFADRVRDGVTAGGSVLVNPTNGASYTWTVLQTQQVASSRLRAMETGRWVVQAAPTGLTAVIDDRGRVLERTDVSERRVIVHEVRLREGHTWYTRIGDRVIVALLGLAFALVALSARVRSRA